MKPLNDYRVVIIRGPQGSGKSTFARTRFPNHVQLEADDFFMVGGNYLFDHHGLKAAHDWCQWRAFKAHDEGIPVVVTNTLSRRWEIEPYLGMCAPEDTLIIRMSTQFQNVHNVPEHVVEAVRSRMEDVPGEVWSHTL